jgi:hypothetical protein
MFRMVIAAALLTLLPATGVAAAQDADFTAQIRPSVATNELLLSQIQQALPASDRDAIGQQSATSLDVGRQLAQQLEQALAIAPDDAARSRLEGILTHTQAAVASLEQVQLETSADAARARLDQARGEAQEGLDELRPLVPPLAVPAALPEAGSLSAPVLDALPLLGVTLMVVGAILRRSAARRG